MVEFRIVSKECKTTAKVLEFLISYGHKTVYSALSQNDTQEQNLSSPTLNPVRHASDKSISLQILPLVGIKKPIVMTSVPDQCGHSTLGICVPKTTCAAKQIKFAEQAAAMTDQLLRKSINSEVPPLQRETSISWVKRTLDVFFALTVFVLFWWLLVGIWLLVIAGSPGTGLFCQQRIGENEKPFQCIKFRTMRPETPQRPTHEISKNAITPVGHYLRKTKLDELPQIWNILRGEMSLVGPRPCLPTQKQVLAARRQYKLQHMRPGITGLAQVNKLDMREPDKLACADAAYEKISGMLIDIRVIMLTFVGKGYADNAKS